MSRLVAISLRTTAVLAVVLGFSCSTVKVQTVGVPDYMSLEPASASTTGVTAGEMVVVTVGMATGQYSTNANVVTLVVAYQSDGGESVIDSVLSPPVELRVHGPLASKEEVKFTLQTNENVASETRIRVTATGKLNPDENPYQVIIIKPRSSTRSVP